MRILFVAMPDSVHAARWISQITDQGWDVHLFPVYTGELHPSLRNITAYGLYSFQYAAVDPSVRLRGLFPMQIGTYRVVQYARRFFPSLTERAEWLARVIRFVKPDIVHSLEFQHSAYLTLEAKRRLGGRFPVWIVSNWGSDIYLFGRLPEHVEKIKTVLAECDYYHCECCRDVKLAKEYGLQGQLFPVCPGGGGFDVEQMMRHKQPGLTSERRTIALKGYQHWAGRALVGLRAIKLNAELIKAEGYRVEIYMPLPEDDLRIAAELLSQETGVSITLISKGSQRDDILRLHGRARVSIGLSISDAISTSALEALVMGSFPIQSNTSCLGEWVEQEVSGSLVPPEDPEAIASALRRALTDDLLVNRAAEINERLTRERLDKSIIQPKVVAAYKNIALEKGLAV